MTTPRYLHKPAPSGGGFVVLETRLLNGVPQETHHRFTTKAKASLWYRTRFFSIRNKP